MYGSIFFLFLISGLFYYCFFFFKQKTAYEIGTGDWSSDVCSSDLAWLDWACDTSPVFSSEASELAVTPNVSEEYLTSETVVASSSSSACIDEF